MFTAEQKCEPWACETSLLMKLLLQRLWNCGLQMDSWIFPFCFGELSQFGDANRCWHALTIYTSVFQVHRYDCVFDCSLTGVQWSRCGVQLVWLLCNLALNNGTDLPTTQQSLEVLEFYFGNSCWNHPVINQPVHSTTHQATGRPHFWVYVSFNQSQNPTVVTPLWSGLD